MPASPVINDLFGHVPQDNAAQTDIEDGGSVFGERLAGEEHYLVPTADPPGNRHTAETIREQVMKIIACVREADTMPFQPDELRNHNVWMPYYCEWLKNGEGDALLSEYRKHIERLPAA